MGLIMYAIVLAVVPQLLDARATLAMRQSVLCNRRIVASNADTCESLATDWSLAVKDFVSINPGVQCPQLVADQQYCVVGSAVAAVPSNSGDDDSGTQSTSQPTSPLPLPPPTTTTSTALPQIPTQVGIVPGCDSFRRVKTGDTCMSIEQTYSISRDQFGSWNPSINSGTPPPVFIFP